MGQFILITNEIDSKGQVVLFRDQLYRLYRLLASIITDCSTIFTSKFSQPLSKLVGIE
jgi:hypothetical protein